MSVVNFWILINSTQYNVIHNNRLGYLNNKKKQMYLWIMITWNKSSAWNLVFESLLKNTIPQKNNSM